MSQKRGLKSSPDWPLKPCGYITHPTRLPKQHAPMGMAYRNIQVHGEVGATIRGLSNACFDSRLLAKPACLSYPP